VDSKGRKLSNIFQIASSYDFSGQATNYALSKDGRVLAWGSNLEGNLASGTPGEDDEGNVIFSRFAVPVSVEVINPIAPDDL
jgi:alpha-tubulin suppressor-like RCC1 family protein